MLSSWALGAGLGGSGRGQEQSKQFVEHMGQTTMQNPILVGRLFSGKVRH